MESHENQELRQSAAEDRGTARLIRLLSVELTVIADEIEKFPIAHGHSYSSEEIAVLQSIDFCGQKLKDIANVLGVISTVADNVSLDRKSIEESVRIEAIKAIVL